MILLLILDLAPSRAMTQKLNLVNLGVETGLVQSQVNSITQDSYGMLWIGTLGGVSRYDGAGFTNYGISGGLVNSFVYRIFADKANNIWMGTHDGLQCFDGEKYTNYFVDSPAKSRFIVALAESNDHTIWFITGNSRLYKIKDKKISEVTIEKAGNLITSIQVDAAGILHAMLHNKGIYALVNNRWIPVSTDTSTWEGLYVSRIFFGQHKETWLLTQQGVFKLTDNHLQAVPLKEGTQPDCLSITQDSQGNTWIGTAKGAYQINPSGVARYIGSGNGLTDNAVFDIFRDKENNTWFASDGNGIYKYSDNSFSFLDKSTGLPGDVVMGLVEYEGSTWIGTSETGLSKYNGGEFQKVIIPSANPKAQKINCLKVDQSGILWIGTIGGGLWQYYKGRFTDLHKLYPGCPVDISSIYEDNDHSIWITSPSGCYFFSDGSFQRINGIESPSFSVFQLSKDSILIGATDGIKLLYKKSTLSAFNIPGESGTTVGQFKKWKGQLLIGSFDKGIWLYNMTTGRLKKCTQQNGLSSDMLFSLLVEENVIYAGTVNGLNKVWLDSITGNLQAIALQPVNKLLGPECNLNAILKDSAGKIWLGTTRGVLLFDPGISRQHYFAPSININEVQLFSKKINKENSRDTSIAWQKIPYNLILDPKENHLTFGVKGIYLSNPDALRYQFMLQGADTGFSAPVNSPSVIYSNLSPGKYIFKAKALVENGLTSDIINYPFEIKPPYYKTTWFQLLAVLVLLSAGAFYQHIRTKIKTKRDEMLKKVRADEQLRIQQKTSEDLHDDLGNKITRISLLADILQSKADTNEEHRRLISQIKENTQALYAGTKDIIWALNPDGNTLGHFFQRIRSFGLELFEDSNVEFVYSINEELFRDIPLLLDYNRNLLMIVKEALNNILKHAAAKQAEISAGSDLSKPKEKNKLLLEIRIQDNGKGIATNINRKGYGLDNMRKRLERINGSLEISANSPTGTTLTIYIKIPLKEG